MKWKSLAIIGGLVALAAIVSLTGDQVAAQDDTRAAIEAVNGRFMEAVANRDAKAIANLYTADGMIMPPGADIVQGSADIRAFWQNAVGDGPGAFVLSTTEVERHGDTVTEVGTFSTKAEDGSEIGSGKYIVIWKNVNGDWKLHRDIWNMN